MTVFDVAAGLVLIVSALIGLSRGAVRELVTLTAFALAAWAAVFLLPVSGPLARHTIHPGWAAEACAVVVVFLVVYIGLRLGGGAVSAMLHRQSTLGALDRTAGLGIGLVRGLVALGAFYLVFTAATPPALAPRWIVDARLYPLSRLSGRAIAAVTPNGVRGAGGLGRVLTDRLSAEPRYDGGEPAGAPPASADVDPYARASDGADPGLERGWAPARRHRTLVVRSDSAQVQ